MPRPGNGIEATVNRLTCEYVEKMLGAVRAYIDGHLAGAGARGAKPIGAPLRRARRGGVKAGTRCYYPGCKNLAVPMYGMFCAAEHKNLPKTRKLKLRERRAIVAARRVHKR
jgi:hypothetical protein